MPIDTTVEEKAIVLAQLLSLNPSLSFSVGAGESKTYSKSEIIKHVEALDEVGKEFVKTQMDFLRAMKTGDIYKVIAPTPQLGV
jgi:hypothetical protein